MSEFASQNLTIGQVNAIVKMLGGEDGAMQFLRGEIVVQPAEFKVWKTIKLGFGPTNADGYRCHIKDAKMGISDWANDIIGKPAFSVSAELMEVDLVNVSVAELGFKKGAKLSDIYARAKERGLLLCPNEVGPALRLQYADQPKGEWLIIGMEPIADSVGDLGLFRVEQYDDALWLHGSYGDPDYIWVGYYRFVFLRPRK